MLVTERHHTVPIPDSPEKWQKLEAEVSNPIGEVYRPKKSERIVSMAEDRMIDTVLHEVEVFPEHDLPHRVKGEPCHDIVHRDGLVAVLGDTLRENAC
jgi:hypothetical protein